MNLFSFLKKKEFFNTAQKKRIVEAIHRAEQQTSGEIRVYVESKNPLVSTIERAQEIFAKLKMQQTEHRNGVLVYMATVHRELALFGDEGIYKVTGAGYWDAAVKDMVVKFKADDICEGLVQCIEQIGQTLKEKFPYDSTTDKNELPDDIVFGK